jgi:hypothetical protein
MLEQILITRPLHPQHLQEWVNSGVSEKLIGLNVVTLEDSSDVDELLDRHTTQRWKHSDHLVPGWAVMGCDPKTGEESFLGAQFKPDNPPPCLDSEGIPIVKPDGTVKVQKYLSTSGSPTQPLFLSVPDRNYWPTVLATPSTPVIITEGAKKAGAALSQRKACISLPGVTTGQKLGRLKQLLRDFCGIGRKVYLAFDSDLLIKPQVRRALDQLGRLICAEGGTVWVMHWNTDHKGLDDYLLAYPDGFERLETGALTFAEWRKQTLDSPDSAIDDYPCRLKRTFDQISDRLKGAIAYDETLKTITIEGNPVELEDFRLALALKFNIECSEKDAISVVKLLAFQNSHNPLQEYLNECFETHPQTEILDNIADRYFGTTDPNTVRIKPRYSRLILYLGHILQQ